MSDYERAVEFFRQLDVFSARYCASLGLTSHISPWGGDAYDRGGPSGAILHYTADPDLESVVRWFVNPKLGAKASAHVVVADRLVGSQHMLDSDLPLVAALPATVVLCRPFDKSAWHATWANGRCFGVECVNAGELRTPNNGAAFTWWPAKDKASAPWTKPWTTLYKAATCQATRWWDPFPGDQLESVVAVLRHVRALFPDYFEPGWILGHEQVQGVRTRTANGAAMLTDKRDPGPTFPLHGIRQAVFDGWRPLQESAWFNPYRADPQWCEVERARIVVAAVQAISGVAEPPEAGVAHARLASAITALALKPGDPFGPWGKLALYLLGYCMPSIERGEYASPSLDTSELTSVTTFQRLMGLQPDGIPGSLTRTALCDRLKDRGF
jgi:N-acetyl-anhydromuramyl-L-alanine amidase AmpD